MPVVSDAILGFFAEGLRKRSELRDDFPDRCTRFRGHKDAWTPGGRLRKERLQAWKAQGLQLLAVRRDRGNQQGGIMFWLAEQVGGVVVVIAALTLTWRIFCWIVCGVGDFLEKHS